MRGTWTIVLLTLSNVFMTLAWCGHLQFKGYHELRGLFLVAAVPVVFHN
jgi:uncharacterized protein (DUF486 family)